MSYLSYFQLKKKRFYKLLFSEISDEFQAYLSATEFVNIILQQNKKIIIYFLH